MSENDFHGWPTKMPVGRIAYVNGRYLPLAQAGVHIEDRALQRPRIVMRGKPGGAV